MRGYSLMRGALAFTIGLTLGLAAVADARAQTLTPSDTTNAANISSGTLPTGRLNLNAAEVVTQESTASTSFTDLTTVGPSLTFTTTGTVAVVWVSATMSRASGTGNSAYMGVAVSGASTVAAAANQSAYTTPSNTGYNNSMASVFILTGLTAGSNTFTAKYKVDGGTMTFGNRGIAVYAP